MNGFWELKHDASLRGDYRYEYVTPPCRGNQLARALQAYRMLAETQGPDSRLFSWRCATHLHMNLLDMDCSHVAPLTAITFAADNYFYGMGAEARRDNYNCRPLSLLIPTAEHLGTICQKVEAQDMDSLMQFLSDPRQADARYSGMNWWSLGKFGTLEVRHFPGTSDPELITLWIAATTAMYHAAERLTFDQVADLVEQGSEAFGEAVFGNLWTDMSYAGHELDWNEMRRGFDYLCAARSAPDATSLDSLLRQQRVIN